MSQPHDGESPIKQLLVSMSGAGGSDHDTEPPGADATSLKAGHEPDRFALKGIIMVPVFVAVTLVMAYVLITVMFSAFVSPAKMESADASTPNGAANAADINARFARTSSTDPKALPGKPDSAVPQPRLEYLKQTQNDGPYGDPAYMRSKLPDQTAPNTYELRPEDLRADRYIDPTTHRKMLAEAVWLDDKKSAARLPMNDETMAMALKKLPIRKDPIVVTGLSNEKAKPSNAGRGGPSYTPPAASVAQADHTKDDHKKDGHK